MSLCKPERSEPIYEGSRSLYTRSPPLTRANLSRSQSVYTKAATGPHVQMREHIRPGGPLYPAQSLYPMIQTSQNANPINQNHQNHQNQQRQGGPGVGGGGENIYGAKPREIYGKIPGGRNDYGYSGMKKQDPNDRNDYVYSGMKKQDSSDNTYNSYISSSSASSKMPPAHMPRKDCHSHQSGMSPAESPYYHSEPSPNPQY